MTSAANPHATIVAVTTTENHPNVARFRKSLGTLKNVRIVGQGAKWKGTMTKVNLFLRTLRSMGKDDIFIGVDCYDLVAQPVFDNNLLVALFNSKNSGRLQTQVIVSGESGVAAWCHYPNNTYFAARPDVPKTRNCHENGGFVMGRACDVIDMFEFCLKNVDEKKSGHSVDQYGIGLYAARFPERVLIDTHQEFCGVVIGNELKTHWVKGEKAFYLQGFKTPPPFMHVPNQRSSRKRKAFNRIWSHLYGKKKAAVKIPAPANKTPKIPAKVIKAPKKKKAVQVRVIAVARMRALVRG